MIQTRRKNYGSPQRCIPPQVNSIVEEKLNIKIFSYDATIILQTWDINNLDPMDDNNGGSMVREHYFGRAKCVAFHD